MFEEIFHKWEDVSTTTIKLEKDNPELLNADINNTNFLQYFLATQPFGYTPILFDTDGSIIETFYGENAGRQYLGFGGPVFGDNNTGTILESLLVVNGKWYNNIDTNTDPERTLDDFKNTIIHEVGHVIGLDHSSINDEALNESSSQELKDSVPLMFPIGISSSSDLKQDDKSSVSLLYPNQSGLGNYGKFEGRVVREDGITPVLGANIIARNIDDPLLIAISCISNYLKDGSGSFSLSAIPPGNYTIEIEPLNILFTGTSNVGPYSNNLCNESFLYPVQKGFYTSPNALITSDRNNALTVNVRANQTTNNINIISITDVANSRYIECNKPIPNFTNAFSSSSSGDPNQLCCQGFAARNENQICPNGYLITYCDALNISGCCPNNSSSSSSSGSTDTVQVPVTPPAIILPNCIWTVCGNNCCVAGCCKSNSQTCLGSPECQQGSSNSSNDSSTPSTDTSEPNNFDFSPPNIIEPPVFLPVSPDDTLSPDTQSTNTITSVEISSAPNFPQIIELPLVPEEFSGVPAFAYPGSNPSIEIKLPQDQIKSTILYVHLKDSQGNIFQNIPFNVVKIPTTPDKSILTLQLPEQVSTGKSQFTLFLHTGRLLHGSINIIDYMNIQIPDTNTSLEKPLISSVIEAKSDQSVTLIIKGKNFVGNKVQAITNMEDTVSLKASSGPQTSVTIFPSSLNIQIYKLNVTKNGNQLEVKFNIPDTLTGKTNATLIITTPRGITSKSFILQ